LRPQAKRWMKGNWWRPVTLAEDINRSSFRNFASFLLNNRRRDRIHGTGNLSWKFEVKNYLLVILSKVCFLCCLVHFFFVLWRYLRAVFPTFCVRADPFLLRRITKDLQTLGHVLFIQCPVDKYPETTFFLGIQNWIFCLRTDFRQLRIHTSTIWFAMMNCMIWPYFDWFPVASWV
jgi:hypothetical protein